MADVFISYKSERRPAARHLQKVLTRYGFDAWYDYGLIPGDDFEPRLMGELRGAKVCVVLWCQLSVTSPWVLKEAAEARRLGTLVPAWIQRATPPVSFSDTDTIDLTVWDGAPRSEALDRLLAEIGRRVGRKPNPDFESLRELHEDWVGFGRPKMSQFALGPSITPERSSASSLQRLGSNRMAYVLSMDGAAVKQIVVNYVCAQSAVDLDQVVSARISISDDFTGIQDHGRQYSSLDLVIGASILISQRLVFDAVTHHSNMRGVGFEVVGTAFELKDRKNADSATEYPIEECTGNFLVTRQLNSEVPTSDLLNLLQQLFWIHEVDTCWFWNSPLAPGARAVRLLVSSEKAQDLAQFIESADPQNSRTTRNQFIDVAWQLIHNHEDWLLLNPSVTDAFILRKQGLTEPLVEKLMELKLGSQSRRRSRRKAPKTSMKKRQSALPLTSLSSNAPGGPGSIIRLKRDSERLLVAGMKRRSATRRHIDIFGSKLATYMTRFVIMQHLANHTRDTSVKTILDELVHAGLMDIEQRPSLVTSLNRLKNSNKLITWPDAERGEQITLTPEGSAYLADLKSRKLQPDVIAYLKEHASASISAHLPQ
jgi:TIR domain